MAVPIPQIRRRAIQFDSYHAGVFAPLNSIRRWPSVAKAGKPMAQASWIPTRKWLAAQITALTAFVVAWVNLGSWDKTLSIALIGLISQALLSYLIPNVDQSSGGNAPVASAPASGVTSR